jgi:hypothetical protein
MLKRPRIILYIPNEAHIILPYTVDIIELNTQVIAVSAN